MLLYLFIIVIFDIFMTLYYILACHAFEVKFNLSFEPATFPRNFLYVHVVGKATQLIRVTDILYTVDLIYLNSRRICIVIFNS